MLFDYYYAFGLSLFQSEEMNLRRDPLIDLFFAPPWIHLVPISLNSLNTGMGP